MRLTRKKKKNNNKNNFIFKDKNDLDSEGSNDGPRKRNLNVDILKDNFSPNSKPPVAF